VEKLVNRIENAKIVFHTLSSSKVGRFTLNQHQNDHRTTLHNRQIHFTSENT